ncbi:DUF1382 family protein [Vreelandella alkaliphila]|uniref:DUF1382 family protein n=1 Tax=Vreelandella alkaliphila TaxID=272774 RepID=A0ABX4HLB6_9GAMM|nr:DUF1382 family protein [Halomonas humidisoli]PAU73306.1 hypothetical protein CK497_01505 [Halomonas humidisoli]
MNKASPVELRKALLVAKAYADAGIQFVPMPVFSEEEKSNLIKEADERLEKEAVRLEEEESANDGR